MLALDVTSLSNELQKQTLEENPVSAASNIKLINPNTGYKLSEATQVKLKTGGSNVWKVSLHDTADPVATKQRNEVPEQVVPRHSAVTRVKCLHKVPIENCKLCDSASTNLPTSYERPKKRNSKSVLETQDNEINIPPAKSSWQPQGSRLWKPIADLGQGYNLTSAYSSVAQSRACYGHGVDEEWKVRQSRWSPSECHRNAFFSSLAPSVQRHRETGHITPDDLLTPPESPVSRPNSVYSDGAISPFCFHMDLNFSKGAINPMPEFRNRSLSVEDKISCVTSSCCGATSAPIFNSSVPSSPHHRYKVPRCRSQPSFYDKKSGRRRRRDLRPTLNFNKMTETAYGFSRRLETRPENINSVERFDRKESRFHSEVEQSMSLMPIASSPRDNDPVLYGPSLEQEADAASQNSVCKIDETVNSMPVKLIGDNDDDEDDEIDMEVYQLTEELDLDEIENH